MSEGNAKLNKKIRTENETNTNSNSKRGFRNSKG